MEEITSNTKSIELAGEEIHVHFTSGMSFFWLRNDSGGTVLMSLSPDIEEGGDGVIEVLAGSSAGTMHGFYGTRRDLYLLGSGKVQVMGTHSAHNPFKAAAKGGGNSGEKILLNIPLTKDLSDISSFERTVEYSGDTPLTIDENGIYLYQGNVVIKNFLNNISRCAVDFDIKINSNGTSRYPQWRRALTIGNLNLGIHYSGNYTTNKFFFEMLGNISFESISPTKSTYADEKFHHIAVYFDVKNQFILAYTDNQDPIAMKYNANDGSNIYIGDDNYGLNGYIKNFVIKET